MLHKNHRTRYKSGDIKGQIIDFPSHERGIRVASTSTSRRTRRDETIRDATRREDETKNAFRRSKWAERSARRGAANKLSATHWATCSSSEVRVWQIKLGVRSGRPLDAAANYCMRKNYGSRVRRSLSGGTGHSACLTDWLMNALIKENNRRLL